MDQSRVEELRVDARAPPCGARRAAGGPAGRGDRRSHRPVARSPPGRGVPLRTDRRSRGGGHGRGGNQGRNRRQAGRRGIVTLGAATGGLVESRTMRHAPAPVVSTVVAPPQAVLRPVAPVAPIEPRAPEPVESVEPPVTPITNAAPSALAPPARQDETTTEIAILEDSQDALQSNPARALAQVDRHAARFPHSALAQEREVIAIEALLRLGRSDEARLRAARFEQSYPTSAHVPRMKRSSRATLLLIIRDGRRHPSCVRALPAHAEESSNDEDLTARRDHRDRSDRVGLPGHGRHGKGRHRRQQRRPGAERRHRQRTARRRDSRRHAP